MSDEQSGWLHGSAMKSSGPTRPPVCSASRRIVPVVVARSIGSTGLAAPGGEHRLDGDARHVVGVEGQVDDGTHLVLVDPLGHGHGQRREDARVRSAAGSPRP